MKCPKCRAEMNRVKRGAVSVDTCGICYGIWLDKNELEAIAAEENSAEDFARAIKELIGREQVLTEEKSIACPRCSRDMKKIKFSGVRQVIADECRVCEGIWFDAAELSAVTDAARKLPAAAGKDVSLLPSVILLLIVLAVLVSVGIWVLIYVR